LVDLAQIQDQKAALVISMPKTAQEEAVLGKLAGICIAISSDIYDSIVEDTEI